MEHRTHDTFETPFGVVEVQLQGTTDVEITGRRVMIDGQPFSVDLNYERRGTGTDLRPRVCFPGTISFIDPDDDFERPQKRHGKPPGRLKVVNRGSANA